MIRVFISNKQILSERMHSSRLPWKRRAKQCRAAMREHLLCVLLVFRAVLWPHRFQRYSWRDFGIDVRSILSSVWGYRNHWCETVFVVYPEEQQKKSRMKEDFCNEKTKNLLWSTSEFHCCDGIPAQGMAFSTCGYLNRHVCSKEYRLGETSSSCDDVDHATMSSSIVNQRCHSSQSGTTVMFDHSMSSLTCVVHLLGKQSR